MIQFASGNFKIKQPDDCVYFYKKSDKDCSIQFTGSIMSRVGIKAGNYIHIFYDDEVPNIVYFTPWLEGDEYRDNSDNIPKGSKLTRMAQQYGRVSCKNSGIFNALKIPCGESKKANTAQSGHKLTPQFIEFQGRQCITVDLDNIPGWREIYESFKVQVKPNFQNGQFPFQINTDKTEHREAING